MFGRLSEKSGCATEQVSGGSFWVSKVVKKTNLQVSIPESCFVQESPAHLHIIPLTLTSNTCEKRYTMSARTRPSKLVHLLASILNSCMCGCFNGQGVTSTHHFRSRLVRALRWPLTWPNDISLHRSCSYLSSRVHTYNIANVFGL